MQYEVEVKALLGSQDAADALLADMRKSQPDLAVTDRQTQLNHYFIDGDLGDLAQKFRDILSSEQVSQVAQLAENAKSFNVRSRQKNDIVLLIIKGSLDERSASHSNQRMELEFEVSMPIEHLDESILSAGFTLEAKWSAERTFYKYRDMTVDMIFSPGYGYMVEFEKVVQSEAEIAQARSDVLNVLAEFGLQEFDHMLIEKMYAYYNSHWQEYYGTKKVFSL